MRSVIQEASTLAKAIEQGWIKAGKPKDFTVKIFEEPQKGFLGLTTKKNAKVGIFIEDRSGSREQRPKKHTPQRRRLHRQDQRPRPPYDRSAQPQDHRDRPHSQYGSGQQDSTQIDAPSDNTPNNNRNDDNSPE